MTGKGLTADQWNARYPKGTPVVAYPEGRPDLYPGWACEEVKTVTTTEAWTTGFGRAVVMVKDHSAWMCLTHVDPRAAMAETP